MLTSNFVTVNVQNPCISKCSHYPSSTLMIFMALFQCAVPPYVRLYNSHSILATVACDPTHIIFFVVCTTGDINRGGTPSCQPQASSFQYNRQDHDQAKAQPGARFPEIPQLQLFGCWTNSFSQDVALVHVLLSLG